MVDDQRFRALLYVHNFYRNLSEPQVPTNINIKMITNPQKVNKGFNNYFATIESNIQKTT